ncbi:MAG TPA: TIGR02269 family lipoprotein [Myxococcus sp.]|nr:TIGR02269 family lipoprotein [Myxococcus sp.]
MRGDLMRLGLLLTVALSACSTVTSSTYEGTECAEHAEDACVTLLCGDEACGFYRCEEVPGGVELALFPPSRPPAAAAAPGSGPRRNWGDRMRLPNGAEPVMVFPWYGTPKPAPLNRQLPAGRFEKHHIFPQASDLARWFSQKGINIHQYTLPIPVHVHRRIHSNGARGGEWNEAWRVFMNANRKATPEEIFKHAGELIYRFQLLGGPIQKYN